MEEAKCPPIWIAWGEGYFTGWSASRNGLRYYLPSLESLSPVPSGSCLSKMQLQRLSDLQVECRTQQSSFAGKYMGRKQMFSQVLGDVVSLKIE